MALVGFRAENIKRWAKIGIRWAVYLVLSLLLLHEATETGKIEECGGTEASVAAMSREDYRKIVKYAIPDPGQAQKVRIVTLGASEPVESDSCQQRLFMARLIRRLKQLNVAVIALDRFYEPIPCPQKDTDELLTAVSGSSAVVTLASRTDLIPKKHRKDAHVCLNDAPGFNLQLPQSNLGIARLDADTRRIPLVWPVVSGGEVQARETFAFVTARAFNKAAINTPLLTKAIAKNQQPFSTMVKIQHDSALEILCGKGALPQTWRDCSTDEAVEGMNGAVVVIGDHYGDHDLHPAVMEVDAEEDTEQEAAPEGLVYGVDLQANYIAALLDKRYYLPLLPEWGDRGVILVFFIVLQVLCWRLEKRLWLAGLIGLVLWGLIALLSFGVLAFTRYLLTVWVHGINLGTVVVSVLEHWVARLD